MCRDADATSWLMGELDFDAGGKTRSRFWYLSGEGKKKPSLGWKELIPRCSLAVLMTGVLHAVCRREVRTALHKGW